MVFITGRSLFTWTLLSSFVTSIKTQDVHGPGAPRKLSAKQKLPCIPNEKLDPTLDYSVTHHQGEWTCLNSPPQSLSFHTLFHNLYRQLHTISKGKNSSFIAFSRLALRRTSKADRASFLRGGQSGVQHSRLCLYSVLC